MQFNAETNVKPVYHVATTAATGNTTPTTGVDCLGYEECLIILTSGTYSGDEAAVWKVQESSNATGSGDSFADVTGAAFASVSTANDEAIQVGRILLRPRERYLRVVSTTTGTGASTDSVVFILSRAKDTKAQNTVTFAFAVTS
jgi:hypothetical protein